MLRSSPTQGDPRICLTLASRLHFQVKAAAVHDSFDSWEATTDAQAKAEAHKGRFKKMDQGETKKMLYYESFSTMTCPMSLPKRHKVAGAPFLPRVRTDQHDPKPMQQYVGGYLGSSIASLDASNFAFARDPNVLTTDSTHQTHTVASHLPRAAQQ